MKILVFSDSHNITKHMFNAIEDQSPQMVLHLGDHNHDCDDIIATYPDLVVRMVRGNGDFLSQEPGIDEFVQDGVHIVMTHGHLYSVKTGLGRLRECALVRNADIMLFGHTHSRHHETYIDGITYINPGSIGLGKVSYAVIELENGTAKCEVIEPNGE